MRQSWGRQAGNGTQREGVGSLGPKKTLDDVHAVPAKDSRPLEVRGYAEEERLALAELRRTIWPETWPSQADHCVQNLLAEGPATLISKGYTREQRQPLLGWQRVMRMTREERGARTGG